MKNIKYILYTILCMFISFNNVLAGANVKTENTNDANTKNDKCPVSITVQDNLKNKDMDFSELDCIYYKTNENGEKVLRTEDDEIDFSCVQKFLDKYTNDEFKEAANGKIAEGFPTTNKYCPVYCVEENEFVFPGYAPVINSGGHFTWTVGKNEDKSILDGLTVRLHGTKACRTHVDLEQWIKDYKDIMKDIEDMIKIKNPTSSNNCTCTPTATQNNDLICAWDKEPIMEEITIMSAATYDIFEKYGNQMEIANTTVGSFAGYIRSALISNEVYPEAAFSDSADSNRFAVVWAIIDTKTNAYDDQQSVGNQITSITSTSEFSETLFRYDKANSPDSFTNIVNSLSSLTDSQTVKIQVYERHCCNWEYEKETGWFKSGTEMSSGDGYAGKERFLRGETVGWRKSNSASNVCSFSYSSGVIKSGFNCGKDSGCCSCKDCKEYTGEEDWLGDPIYRWYKCRDSSSYSIVKDARYKVVCPTEGTQGTQAQVIAGTTRKCLCGSVPTCPSGYTYSSRTGKCYYADINGIKEKIGVLSGLRASLKQCSDQLKDYDYYLETDMEVEYNETNDSSKNFYLPNKDGVTNTKLIRIEENDSLDNNENKLGKYSSDIIKPSEKSNVSGSISFFGKTYYFDKNSIPLVYCSLSGNEKICSAAQSSAYSDYWYDWFARTYVAIYEYRLDGNFYKWVKMPSGESISTEPVGDYKKYNRFIDIGYANYPVHYSTKGGLYEGLNVKITNIGYKNYLYNTYQTAVRNYNSSLTDNDFVNTEGQNQLLHDCYYEVDEGEPYCPSKGCDNDEYDLGSVRLIYRPISLESPFPGMDASGRNTGSNWCILNSDKTTNCKNTNENVEKYILNNRNTEGSSIYNKDPMYEITLTPALIKEIRNYNSKTNYDDYYVYCSGEKGKEGSECKSKFVRGESVSIDSMPGVLGDLADNISKAITGCGKDEWDSCDKLDNYER